MAGIPEEMNAIDPAGPGGPEVLAAGPPAGADAEGRARCWSRWRRPGVNRPDVLPAPRPLSAAARRAVDPRARNRRQGGRARRRGSRHRDRPAGLRLARGRRLCRICGGAGRPVPAGPGRADHGRGGGACRKPCSPSGAICSSAAMRATARPCSSMAAPAASAPWRSRLCNLFGLTHHRHLRQREKSAGAPRRSAPTMRSTIAPQDFVAEVKRITAGRGVEIVLDMVGGDYLPRNLACLAEDGRHVSIAVQRGATAELNIAAMMMRRLTLTGSTLRPRPVRVQVAGRRRDRTRGLAAGGGGEAQAGDPRHFPAGPGRRGASADGIGRTCRQDRADELTGGRDVFTDRAGRAGAGLDGHFLFFGSALRPHQHAAGGRGCGNPRRPPVRRRAAICRIWRRRSALHVRRAAARPRGQDPTPRIGWTYREMSALRMPFWASGEFGYVAYVERP